MSVQIRPMTEVFTGQARCETLGLEQYTPFELYELFSSDTAHVQSAAACIMHPIRPEETVGFRLFFEKTVSPQVLSTLPAGKNDACTPGLQQLTKCLGEASSQETAHTIQRICKLVRPYIVHSFPALAMDFSAFMRMHADEIKRCRQDRPRTCMDIAAEVDLPIKRVRQLVNCLGGLACGAPSMSNCVPQESAFYVRNMAVLYGPLLMHILQAAAGETAYTEASRL